MSAGFSPEEIFTRRTIEERFCLSSPDNPQPDRPLLPSEPRLSAPPIPYSVPPPTAASSRVPKAGENPVWSGWDVLVIAILTLGILFVVQLVIVLAARQFADPHRSWIEVEQKPVLALLAELVAYFAVGLYMFLLVEGKYHARFWPAIRWNWPGVAGLSIFGVGVLMLGFDALGRFLPMPKTTPFDQFFERPMDAYLTVAFAVTLGPLMEELFFRGFLYPVIARRMGVAWGVILTALPFGLMHYAQYRSWSAVLIIILVGVVLTTVRAVTKSVAASFLAHVGYNGTLMVLAAVATDGFRHMEKVGVVLF
jgi:membrane protease YdiL (CAAX protease family)